jgi:hypothetical protein
MLKNDAKHRPTCRQSINGEFGGGWGEESCHGGTRIARAVTDRDALARTSSHRYVLLQSWTSWTHTLGFMLFLLAQINGQWVDR